MSSRLVAVSCYTSPSSRGCPLTVLEPMCIMDACISPTDFDSSYGKLVAWRPRLARVSVDGRMRWRSLASPSRRSSSYQRRRCTYMTSRDQSNLRALSAIASRFCPILSRDIRADPVLYTFPSHFLSSCHATAALDTRQIVNPVDPLPRARVRRACELFLSSVSLPQVQPGSCGRILRCSRSGENGVLLLGISIR